MKNFFSSLFSASIEKILFIFFGVGMFFSILGLGWVFFQEHSEEQVSYGGVYTEGAVGSVSGMVLNPVYTYGKRDQSIDADITSLVFSGLMKFNSQTGKVEDNLGTHTLSADKKTYTFRLNQGILWHDGEAMTANDVVFTYRDVISHPDFSNTSLRRAFEKVEIKKVSDMEVSFTLPYPYKFFLTNFTVGLLPRHILENTPVSELEYSDFSQTPIGNGLYSFTEMEEVRPNVFKITLDAFRKSSLGDPKLDTIELFIYPSKNALSLDSDNLMAVRPFPKKIENTLFIDNNLEAKSFALPQYSALFFNLHNDIFKGEKGKMVRTGLQVGTNKKALLDIVPGVRIDTPLLEIKEGDWLYEYSVEKANGAFKSAGYYFPSKKPKTVIPLNSADEWIIEPVKEPEWIEESSVLHIKGVFPPKTHNVKIYWNKEEKIIFEKKDKDKDWELKLQRDDSLEEKRNEFRVKFFDKEDSLLKEDALSVYWEKLAEENENDKNIIDSEGENVKKEEDSKNISLEEILKRGEMRETIDGKPLHLTLLTSEQPAYYGEVAHYLQEDWKKMGVDLEIKILPYQEFLDSVSHREYDILLYGQNLGYNLDIYEFFHASQVGKDNLSEYKSQAASILIEEIRVSHVSEVREKKLQELREILKNDIPAVFLFSPAYQYYYSPQIKGMNITYIAFLRDRFSNIDKWYIEQDRSLKEDVSWNDFFQWFSHNYISFITFSL
jgi:ABC-type transport system substrate-binding protein